METFWSGVPSALAWREDGDLALCRAESAGAGGVGVPDVEDVAAHRAAGVFDGEDRIAQTLDAQARAERVDADVGGDCAPMRLRAGCRARAHGAGAEGVAGDHRADGGGSWRGRWRRIAGGRWR
jgi:hypothetical protein